MSPPGHGPSFDGAVDALRWHVVVAGTAWGDACHRGMNMPHDRLLAQLIGDPRVGRLLVANPFRSVPLLGVRWVLGDREPPLTARAPGVRAKTTPKRLRRRDPVGVAALERSYARYDRSLRRKAARLGLRRPAVIVSSPLVAAFAPLAWAGPVTYYAFDDWAAYPPERRWWSAYEVAYERIRQRGHRVVAVSQVLLDRIRPTGACRVVPNGVAAEEWLNPPRPPAWFEALSRPRLVYVGTLDDRIDVPAIIELSERFSGGTVVLAGGEPANAMQPLRGRSNVVISASVPRPTVVSIVHNAELCIMPHRRTALTEAMSPLKLYEYLAGGRPVVATDLSPVRAVDRRIVLVPAGGSFGDQAQVALVRGPMGETDRQAFISENSWASRIDAIVELAMTETRDPDDHRA